MSARKFEKGAVVLADYFDEALQRTVVIAGVVIGANVTHAAIRSGEDDYVVEIELLRRPFEKERAA